jgi:hypothetical protein
MRRLCLPLSLALSVMYKVLRHISLEEAEILRRTLEVGATEAISAELYASISKLPITAVCECGCKTVWFGPNGAAATGNILAEGFAVQGGQPLEIIVWSEQEACQWRSKSVPPGRSKSVPVGTRWFDVVLAEVRSGAARQQA